MRAKMNWDEDNEGRREGSWKREGDGQRWLRMEDSDPPRLA